ncbi:MAG: hybrid sensor histidine kinase/response regulator [Hyphomicrobiales bacterium]|nr:hybrid sensor histidine kinase/response regulator [Hyphomicrobiales bacterium]
MIAGWAAVLATLAYICLLFAIAHYGDTFGRRFVRGPWQTGIYALSLAVYCTSWTFFGSVGLASTSGFQFLPIYIGPLLVIGFARPLVARIVNLARNQNITSVADFVAARYGKAESVAICVVVICVVGTVPYIALQLKAVGASLDMVLGSIEAERVVAHADALPFGVLVPVVLAGFAMAFGTRRVDATEHQDGLMLAVASESLVKLLAFVAVGAAVTWSMFGGLGDLWSRGAHSPAISAVFTQKVDWPTMVVMTLLSAIAIVLLPRQFHVTVVENRDERDLRASSWLFPLYLVAINLFVVPLAVAGRLVFPDGAIDRDMTVLALPLKAGDNLLAVFAMLGGISASTAMIIVECVALSIMVSNDLVLPLALRRRRDMQSLAPGAIGWRILLIRRVAILLILALGYLYLRVASDAALVSIGLISFACIAQIAPAFFGGLFWRGGSAAGAIAGMVSGALVWAYTLFLPSIQHAWGLLAAIADNGAFGLAALKPTALLGVEFPQIVHGAIASLSVNIILFVAVSLLRRPSRLELLQASNFVRQRALPSPGAFRLWRASVTADELETTVARYLGASRARASFDTFLASRGLQRERNAEADVHMLRFAERLLASAIGAASSRLVLSLVLRRRNVSHKAALRLVDEASAAIQYNRDLLQYALDFARQGITVFDHDRRLICWNREFRDLFDLPGEILRVGVGLQEIVRFNAQRGLYGEGVGEEFVATRVDLLLNERRPIRIRLFPSTRVIEIRSAAMPDGGVVTTYTDVSAQVDAEEALEATNETLEQRVRDRTTELERLNEELEAARTLAEAANISKTRFLAAASHDILQPLNAARLYATSLSEQTRAAADPAQTRKLAENVDASLEAVEEILTALLDISRLDAGAMKAEISALRLDDVFSQLEIEFAPLAKAKGLDLSFVRSSLSVRSDRRLLRRLLQNFVSNAIKYTPAGRVLIGARREGARVRLEVWDTGLGIPAESRADVFREFARLEPAQRSAPGLGLGLSIVERLARVLEADLGLDSRVGSGSVFFVDVPLAPATWSEPGQAAVEPSAPASAIAGLLVCAIDNEPRILDGMRTLLGGWGCRVATAASRREAFVALEQIGAAPDAIVADYHLDGDDGLSVIAALREKFGADVPAVLATADRSEEVREAAAALEIRILAKPLRPAALRSLLAQWRVTRNAAE